jgi:hypothetical protein
MIILARLLCVNAVPGIPGHQRASDTSAKLRLLFIIYCIIILFQALSVHVLADIPVSENTADLAYSHIPNKTVNAQIVSGEPATDGEFPFMATLYRRDGLGCDGAILSSQWVLTGVWCMIKTFNTNNSLGYELHALKSNYYIRYGSIEEESLIQASIRSAHVHPQYNPKSGFPHSEYNELALIELEEPLPSNGKWRPVRIVPKEVVSPGDELMLLDWGYKNNGGRSATLQKLLLTASSYSECQSGARKWDSQDEEFLCTITGHDCDYIGHTSPLVLHTPPSNNEHFTGYLVGIRNGWSSVGNAGSNGDTLCMIYFTLVAKHVDWIASVMGVNSSELLAYPEFRFRNSATSFAVKRFDNVLHSIALCLLALPVITFNN